MSGNIVKNLDLSSIVGKGKLPTGGTSGQILSKKSATNYDTTWTNLSGSGITGVNRNYSTKTISAFTTQQNGIGFSNSMPSKYLTGSTTISEPVFYILDIEQILYLNFDDGNQLQLRDKSVVVSTSPNFTWIPEFKLYSSTIATYPTQSLIVTHHPSSGQSISYVSSTTSNFVGNCMIPSLYDLNSQQFLDFTPSKLTVSCVAYVFYK